MCVYGLSFSFSVLFRLWCLAEYPGCYSFELEPVPFVPLSFVAVAAVSGESLLHLSNLASALILQTNILHKDPP